MAEDTARTSVPSDQQVEPTELNRAAHALGTQQTFTREQVAWLMAQAMRWGYENRINDEETAWPPDDYFIAGELIRDLDRKKRRDEWYASARLPRRGDFQGCDSMRAAA